MKNPIAICQWVLPEPDNKPFHQAKNLGIDGLVIDFKREGQDSLIKKEVRQQLMEASRETGVYIPTLALNAFISKGIIEKDNHSELLDLTHEAVEIASEMGIRKLQIPCFYKSFIHTDEDVDHAIDFFKEAVKLGKSRDIIIGSENVMTIGQNLKVIEEVDSKYYKLLFDTQNPWRMMNQDGVRIAASLKEHVCEVHAKDSDFDLASGEKTFQLLGDGDVNFYGSMKHFHDIKFMGYIVLESPYGLSKEFPPLVAIREDITRIRMI